MHELKKIIRSVENRILRLVPARVLVSTVGLSLANKRYGSYGKGKMSYRRFLILTHQRSGSNLLTTTLNTHPHVVCDNELFHKKETYFGIGERSYLVSPWIRAIRDFSPDEFVDTYIYGPHAGQVRAVGFKIFVTHYQNARFKGAIDRILNSQQLSIVRLSRINKLDTILSEVVALKSGRWIARVEDTPVDQPVFIDPDYCLHKFLEFELEDKIFDEICENRNHISITYEELFANFDPTIQKVTDFLSVEAVPLYPIITKQRKNKTLEESITNYASLKKRFESSKWQGYFE